MSKYQLKLLTYLLPHTNPMHFTDSQGGKHFGVMQSVEPVGDDGSSFKLTIRVESGDETFSIRTLD